ncbi:EamA family transporter [Dysgonomonas reticulitermitis]
MWKYYAILSAVFASLTAIFAKIGIKNVDSNLATAIRTCVILLITWGIVFASGGISGIKELTKMNWAFLILSGIATGLSWLFYFKALQLGDASKVAPIDKLSVVFTIFLSFIILRETVSWKVIVGGLFIAGGSLVILMDKQ